MDENGPVWENQTFSSPVRTIKIVHPDFFQLQMIQPPSCDANSYEFRLSDPSGTLTDLNLDNISWTIPPEWSSSSGTTSSSIIANTNNENEGKKKVKIKYEAIATKMINGLPDEKKCVASREIEAEIDISACLSQLNYPPQVASNPTSHSGIQTTFGVTVLSPDHYNFASGGLHTLLQGFEFTARANSTLNLFIEECSCTSEWHDPTLMGSASVNITNPWIGASNKRETDNAFKSFQEENHTEKKNITLYPNPVESMITISNLSQSVDIFIEIYDINQKIILQQNGKSDVSGSFSLKLDKLPSGMYLLHIKSENKNLISSKIIKF